MIEALISVVILTFNGKEYVEGCLSSVLSQTYPNIEVIVVDNNSKDGTPELIEQRFPSVRLIRNGSNLGFAAGNNIGMQSSNGKYIALLNQDTTAKPTWLEELVKVAEQDERIGSCASKILYMDDSQKINAAGVLIAKDMSCISRGIGEVDDGQYDHQEEIFIPYDAAVLYRKKMIDEIGVYDADYFLYHEESDLAFRAMFARWKCIYVPTAVAYHARSTSAGLYSPLKLYYGERNRIWNVVKFLPLTLVISSICFSFRRYIAMVFFAFSGKSKKAQAARKHSLVRLAFVLIKAWLDAMWGLPQTVRKRRKIWKTKQVSNSELKKWLKLYSASLTECVEK